MSCVINSILQSLPDGCFCPSGKPTNQAKTIGIVGRTLFEDFEPKGIIKIVVGNSITYNLISENRFMNGMYRNTTYLGLEGVIDFEKMFYSKFKKRKKLSK